MNTREKVPVTILTGFLGSGKTTLLRNWRRDKTLRAAPLIVHDLSEFGLDARTLADEGSQPVPGRLVDGIAALHGKHASPAPPVYPALHRQSVISTPGMLVTAEFAGHAKQSSTETEFVLSLYV